MVAPFRSFLQHRQAHGHKGNNWSFLAQRASLYFLYKDEFEGMLKDGTLTRLDTAFSRDQTKKIYVQGPVCARTRKSCGRGWNAVRTSMFLATPSCMARDVEQTLLDTIADGKNCSPENAQEYLNDLQQSVISSTCIKFVHEHNQKAPYKRVPFLFSAGVK